MRPPTRFLPKVLLTGDEHAGVKSGKVFPAAGRGPGVGMRSPGMWWGMWWGDGCFSAVEAAGPVNCKGAHFDRAASPRNTWLPPPQLKSLGDRQAPYGRVLSLSPKVAERDVFPVYFPGI